MRAGFGVLESSGIGEGFRGEGRELLGDTGLTMGLGLLRELRVEGPGWQR